jgi:hypothetical protein
MVFQVVRRTYCTLDGVAIGRDQGKTRDLGLDLTSDVVDVGQITLRAGIESVVRATDSDKISDGKLGIARLHDVSPDEGSLGQPHDIELLLTKNGMLIDLVAGLIDLWLERGKDGGNIPISNLDALHMAIGASRELIH